MVLCLAAQALMHPPSLRAAGDNAQTSATAAQAASCEPELPGGARCAASRVTEASASAHLARIRDELTSYARQRAIPGHKQTSSPLLAARQAETELERTGRLRPATQQSALISDRVSESAWQQIGPAPINNNHIGFFGASNSGRATSVALVNSNLWYVTGADGGVWKTTDGGASWTPLTDYQVTLAGGSLAVDPADTDMLWVGTGESNGTGFNGAGILASYDGGTTWQLYGSSLFGGASVARIAVDPSSAIGSRTLYAAYSWGLAKSTDGGITWTQIDSSDSTDVVLSGGNVIQARYGSGLFLSTSAGASFSQVLGGPTSLGRIRLAAAPSNPSIIYASEVYEYGAGNPIGVYRSTDGGFTWQFQGSPDTSYCNPSWYTDPIAIDPTSASVIYVGGFWLCKSTDSGTSWTDIGSAVHVDQHDIELLPSSPGLLVVANDGGVFKSADYGSTWAPANGAPPNALALTQGYRGAVDPGNPDHVLIGTQDNGTIEDSGQLTWTSTLGGDGSVAVIDYSSPQTAYATADGDLYSSSDGGSTWTRSGTPFQNTGRVVQDPFNPSALYLATSKRVYRSVDEGGTWSDIVGYDLTQGSLQALAASAASPGLLFSGSSTGAIFATSDYGSHWTVDFGDPVGLPYRPVTSVAPDPITPNTLFATFSGYNSWSSTPGHVFRSTDGGSNWTDVSTSLPDIPVNVALRDPAIAGLLYIGTDIGAFKSSDAGATWSTLNAGLPNASVQDLVLSRTEMYLYGVTYGRSVYRLSRPRPANDSFASAQLISPGTLTGSTDLATNEAGEPIPPPPCQAIGNTVWFKLIPEFTGGLNVNTHGSSFDTIVAVYTGTNLNALTFVGCNDDDPNAWPTSNVTVSVTKGYTYYIQLGGWSGATGAYVLNTSLTAPTCSPRPAITVHAVPVGGVLSVSVAAANVAGNLLEYLHFSGATNALINIGGVTGDPGNSLLATMPPGTQQVTFTVRRSTVGIATTVPFTVKDGCSTPWPTFVGGGPLAGF